MDVLLNAAVPTGLWVFKRFGIPITKCSFKFVINFPYMADNCSGTVILLPLQLGLVSWTRSFGLFFSTSWKVEDMRAFLGDFFLKTSNIWVSISRFQPFFL